MWEFKGYKFMMKVKGALALMLIGILLTWVDIRIAVTAWAVLVVVTYVRSTIDDRYALRNGGKHYDTRRN